MPAAPELLVERPQRRTSLMGARMFAVLVDALVLVIPLVGIDLVMGQAFPNQGFFADSTRSFSGTSTASVSFGASGVLLLAALSLSYFFVGESLYGRTVGKRAMGLRVISSRGGAASVNGVSARTVLRLIDGLALYLVGALVAILSGPRRRRLGDLAGRTMVVREEDAANAAERRPGWLVAVYPAVWVGAVLTVVFGLGLGTAVGASNQAVALVGSYAHAREQGNATLACSMLSVDQQRELVARVTQDYQTAIAARCPNFVLSSSSASSVVDPYLGQFAAGPLTTSRGPLGAVVVASAQFPNISMVAVQQGGGMVLDARGLQKVSFVSQCTAGHQLSAAGCFCVYEWLRANRINPYGDSDYHPSASFVAQIADAARTRCTANPANVPF